MSYEPYRPGGSDDPTPTYDVYQPQVEPVAPRATMRTAVGGSRTVRRSSGSRALGAAIGVVLSAVGGIIAAVKDGDDVDPAGTDYQRYAACAEAHDETQSLFSDEEWCDLGLNGGDGDGIYDEDPYGFDEDPYGFDDDTYGFEDDPYGLD